MKMTLYNVDRKRGGESNGQVKIESLFQRRLREAKTGVLTSDPNIGSL